MRTSFQTIVTIRGLNTFFLVGRMPQGCVTATMAGRLPYNKMIIHAPNSIQLVCFPDWSIYASASLPRSLVTCGIRVMGVVYQGLQRITSGSALPSNPRASIGHANEKPS